MATREEILELVFTLDNYPEELMVANADRLLVEAVRKNKKRGAQVTIEVPDELVQHMKTPRMRSEEKDLLLLVRIPAAMRERARSPIVTPSERRNDRKRIIPGVSG